MNSGSIQPPTPTPPPPPHTHTHLVHIHRDRLARVDSRVQQQRVALGQHIEAQFLDERDARTPAVLDVQRVGDALLAVRCAKNTKGTGKV